LQKRVYFSPNGEKGGGFLPNGTNGNYISVLYLSLQKSDKKVMRYANATLKCLVVGSENITKDLMMVQTNKYSKSFKYQNIIKLLMKKKVEYRDGDRIEIGDTVANVCIIREDEKTIIELINVPNILYGTLKKAISMGIKPELSYVRMRRDKIILQDWDWILATVKNIREIMQVAHNHEDSDEYK